MYTTERGILLPFKGLENVLYESPAHTYAGVLNYQSIDGMVFLLSIQLCNGYGDLSVLFCIFQRIVRKMCHNLKKLLPVGNDVVMSQPGNIHG